MYKKSNILNYKVYKHTTPNGKIYIGITNQTVNERWANGKGYKHNSYFTRAIHKYGWENIKHEILFSGLTKEEACKKEIELIEQYQSNKRIYGYNISSGGEAHSGCKHTYETKKIISEKQKGKHLSEETKRKISESVKGRNPYWCTGKHLSDEHRSKISKALKGKCIGKYVGGKSPKAKSVDMLDINDNYIKSFDSTTNAQRETGIDYGSIVKCCRQQRMSAGGYHWRYSEVKDVI